MTLCGAVLLPVALLDHRTGLVGGTAAARRCCGRMGVACPGGLGVAVCARRQAGGAGGRTGAPVGYRGRGGVVRPGDPGGASTGLCDLTTRDGGGDPLALLQCYRLC